jgi:multicomponent Na+:H+ antiporter subunit E
MTSPDGQAPRRASRAVPLLRTKGWFLLWLVFVWAALWGSVSAGVLISGLLVAMSLLVLFPQAAPGSFRGFRLLGIVRFAAYFFYKLVQANLLVAWMAITPRSRIEQGIVRVPIRSSSDGVVTLLSNAISLTPGTLTVEVRRDPTVLYIHVLHLRDVEEVREDVRRLESLVLNAFAPTAIRAKRRVTGEPEDEKA